MKLPQQQSNEEWVADYNAENVSQISPRIDEKSRFSTAREESSLQEDDLPLIAPGKYIGRYVRHELRKGMFGEGTCKLCIKFEVSGNGIIEHVSLEAWFPAIETKYGFSFSKRSKYAHQFFSVFPDSTETRMDRLSPKKFKGLNLEVEVETVVEDSDHNPKPKALYYSKVGRIIGRKK
jgi:hypothetical protein